ncbi:hydroxysteroid 17-beta dehydrogenase 12 [Homo sapiens]|uniref:Hydroxysteroid 17-beta dehydrogenase 12 n=1 Tax=Homo sapiens TaxID=9606 RepID=A0A1B0GW85_HUMAN|nr:hydroxysteroid 17-beta dehydrogenase 12 [Homo sapiens]KAI4070841.1 hydroxysteroid 17-beta dehydrogenase 12 [Homo sapiens]
MESALPAAGFLYWVGAGTVAYLALRISYSLFTALRVWGVGNEAGVGPGLGEWADDTIGTAWHGGKIQRGYSEHFIWQWHAPCPTLDHLFCNQDFCRFLLSVPP